MGGKTSKAVNCDFRIIPARGVWTICDSWLSDTETFRISRIGLPPQDARLLITFRFSEEESGHSWSMKMNHGTRPATAETTIVVVDKENNEGKGDTHQENNKLKWIIITNRTDKLEI